ncbi:PREDICTED: NEDD8-conjugating enzyme UBE2F-like [Amphimedon queenslandica]|uniref:E2 NEDD8-conjugating enzyme n=1 Tax=Amphimedon queenslandica TaxID=400682 RepID=A0A1X7UG76_AMPQE|nr:PREDICTED: NEDD8-conjugating enzyme UBE2F-like [Amphimedon queenslandica]|eukprot:XP_003388007.1 PREDICTED: NEDD8-conjugating enzyme UBE2F-like [Amphimedon queenslandica]
MITIRKKLAEQAAQREEKEDRTSGGKELKRRQSFRSQILTAEASELGDVLPKSCTLKFDNPDNLRQFQIVIEPDEGYWKNGRFTFEVTVPPEYNIKPPSVICLTRLWHPNINETGDVCLSILRETSIDGTGWSPARRLKDVVLGLNSLFSDLLNFDDPLNLEAAKHYQKDKVSFARKVQQFVHLYAN